MKVTRLSRFGGRQFGFVFLAGSLALTIASRAAEDLAPLEIKLPVEAFTGTPPDIPLNEHIEKPSDKSRAPFVTFKGAKLVSEKKPVTLSDKNPINGSAELVTDGNIRLYSQGSTYTALNRYTEVEVFGVPAR